MVLVGGWTGTEMLDSVLKLNILTGEWAALGTQLFRAPSLVKAGLGIRSFQKNAMFLRSFPFFIKEPGVLYVLFRSL